MATRIARWWLRETGYIDYHKSLADKSLKELETKGYKVYHKELVNNGWGDGMKSVEAIIEDKQGNLRKIQWHDANAHGQWME